MSITKKYYLFTRTIKEEVQCTAEGTREGYTRVYYRNGTLKKEMVYKKGRKEGIEKDYSKLALAMRLSFLLEDDSEYKTNLELLEELLRGIND